MQFQEVSDGLVLVLGELENGPAWLHWWVDGVQSPPGTAKVSSEVWPGSEWVRAVRRGHTGRHNRWWSVELEAVENLMRRDKGGCKSVNNKKDHNAKEEILTMR